MIEHGYTFWVHFAPLLHKRSPRALRFCEFARNRCRGRGSNPHAAFAAQDFKSASAYVIVERIGPNRRFLACFRQPAICTVPARAPRPRLIPASYLPVRGRAVS